jgi:hypothetical protein
MVTLHKRYQIVTGAHLELTEFMLKLQEKNDLTYVELNEILLSEALSWNKYAKRQERHPNDPDKKGDEA